MIMRYASNLIPKNITSINIRQFILLFIILTFISYFFITNDYIKNNNLSWNKYNQYLFDKTPNENKSQVSSDSLKKCQEYVKLNICPAKPPNLSKLCLSNFFL